MRKWLAALAVTVVLAAGCGAVEESPSPSSSQFGDTSSVYEARFGDSVTLKDGQGTIRVDAPTRAEGSDTVVVEVTESNDSGEERPAGWNIRVEQGGSQIDPAAEDKGGFPAMTRTLAAGESVRYKVAFAGVSGSEVTVVASPPALYDRVVFR